MINTMLTFTTKTMMDQKNWLAMRRLSFQSLLYHFLQASAENCINFEVIEKRNREIGIVVPTKYNAFTKNKKIAMILDEELTV